MNLFDIFEGRMQQIFERGNTMAPFPFKKLAKTAVREMKSCSAKLDGRQVAPTLYTILVSPSDDALIGPLYQQVTDELVDFLAHEAQNAGLALTANPTVRFIPVGDIKPGKMEVIAEIVSPDVLEQVRAEESDYVRGRSKSGAVMPQGRANQQCQAAAAPMPGMPDPMAAPLPPLQPLPGANQPAGMATPRQTAPEPAAMPGAAPAPMPVPAAGRPAPVACQLTDKASGKTWRIA